MATSRPAKETRVEVAPDRAFIGLPGTGKTTTLLDVLQGELSSNVDIENIAASTFRRLMADEFRERAESVAGELPDEHWLRTTHSICYHLLRLDRDDVIDEQTRIETCEEAGVEYEAAGYSDDEADWQQATGSGDGFGASLFHHYSYCRNVGLDPVTEWRQNETLRDTTRVKLGRGGEALLEEFIGTYERKKADRHVVDFDDMLVECIEQQLSPPVEVLIEDEFQDKSPLQVQLYNLWADRADRVYVAGDPYQAIYGFMGTRPEYMETAHDTAANPETLDTSYRFGPSCWNVATGILTTAGYDVPDIEPTGETEVHRIDWTEYQPTVSDIPNEDTLHLARCNYMLGDVATVLSDAGVVFRSNQGQRWTQRQLDLYNGVVKVRSVLEKTGLIGEGDWTAQMDFSTVTMPEAEQLISALKATLQAGTKKGNRETIEDAEKRSEFDLRGMLKVGTLREALVENNPFGTHALTDSGVGGHSLRHRMRETFDTIGGTVESIDHEITTIHGAKGREASHVFLHDAVSPRIHSEATPFPRADEQEARVFFVGATRAVDHLWLVDSRFPHSITFPTESEC